MIKRKLNLIPDTLYSRTVVSTGNQFQVCPPPLRMLDNVEIVNTMRCIVIVTL